ncbi:hypothetical protein CDL15_Pgr003624 [Punica granatum]|uniref:Uncharacterized protein n=1 Tax=Punica granatum TaxID=22663 RepID=A0A218XVA6_PUNGR|nr:hypothetical protein CDL15_Pgr003624 [Punica granatum]
MLAQEPRVPTYIRGDNPEAREHPSGTSEWQNHESSGLLLCHLMRQLPGAAVTASTLTTIAAS